MEKYWNEYKEGDQWYMDRRGKYAHAYLHVYTQFKKSGTTY